MASVKRQEEAVNGQGHRRGFLANFRTQPEDGARCPEGHAHRDTPEVPLRIACGNCRHDEELNIWSRSLLQYAIRRLSYPQSEGQLSQVVQVKSKLRSSRFCR